MSDHDATDSDCLLTVVMVDGGFRERFHALDSLAGQTLPPDRYEVLWVEHFDRLRPGLRERIDGHRHVRAVTLGRRGTYHSSYCFNEGIRAGRGDLLVIPDGDVVVEPDFLETVLAAHATCERLALYVCRYDEPREAHVDRVNLEHLRRVCVHANPLNYGGCLSVRRRWLLEINGYEQHPVFAGGFHANGLDVNTRLRNLGLPIMWHPALRLYHPWHPQTLAADESYRLQVLVIRDRSVRRQVRAFEGIDADLGEAMPPALADALERARRRERRPTVRLLRRVSRWIS